MKPFDLEAALRGDKVVTRDGRDVTDIYFFKTSNSPRNLMVVIQGHIFCYFPSGRYEITREDNSEFDLFMATIKKKGWIILTKPIDTYFCEEGVYDSKEEAQKDISEEYQRVVEIEWEE